MLKQLAENAGSALYEITSSPPGQVQRLIFTAPETRAICNESLVLGWDYTQKLRAACQRALELLGGIGCCPLQQHRTVIHHILRGGLNFGLREAAAGAFGWNLHGSSFVSAQRERDAQDPESWRIVESGYNKIFLPARAQIVAGDVVASGTSLRYGLDTLVQQAAHDQVELESMLVFTIGGIKTEEVLAELDARCREVFPRYRTTTLCYLEGRFTVPSPLTPLSIRITGTDLVRYGALMAPEFLESQYVDPAFPLERCVIYDAGSRAFCLPEYLDDVVHYWREVAALAERGMTFEQQLRERAPELDPARFGEVDLGTLAARQIERLRAVLSGGNEA